MRHMLKIKVSKERCNSGIVTCRCLSIRERILRFLFGSPIKLTVLVPGDSVDEIAIREVANCDDEYD